VLALFVNGRTVFYYYKGWRKISRIILWPFNVAAPLISSGPCRFSCRIRGKQDVSTEAFINKLRPRRKTLKVISKPILGLMSPQPEELTLGKIHPTFFKKGRWDSINA
jgi:hypothetical protein